MANLLDKLRKENNQKDKMLTKENDLIMTDIVVYLRSSDLCDYDIEVIRRELFGMIYEAQLRNEPANQVIGNDYKSFCEELMKNGRREGFYEKFLDWAYIGIIGVGTLLATEMIFSGFLLNLFFQRNFNMPITAGFITSAGLIMVMATLVYWFFAKYSFELSGSGSTAYKVWFVLGFTVCFAGIVMIKVLLDDIILFQLNGFIPVLLFSVAYLLIKILEDRNANQIAMTHK